ncbi:MAG: phytoene desaturase family protein [Saccharofermentanales bacterium]|jgi:prolycopene isomerase
MDYDVIVIGAGLSGLTAASLLAKRGLYVGVIDHGYMPGGSCGVFKRGDVTFDVGSSMLYGFGEHGFNAHRFIFNCLEEPIDMIRHDALYCVHFRDKRVVFYDDVERFAEELAELFPSERDNIRRFYRDMTTMYRHVMVETPNYTTPDETDPQTGLKGLLRHPLSYIRFLSYLNKSAKSLLSRYFKDPDIFNFFDKMTSTYCYATVEEAPAILAAVMFVDNHVGGSYYPAGSTLFLPGKLEKVIEAHGGDMILSTDVTEIVLDGDRAVGVRLDDGRTLRAEDIVYSGTVWNLYDGLIPEHRSSPERRAWAKAQVPTYPSVVLYSVVDREVIPDETLPIEMLVGNPSELDESEVTAYIFSIDDRTLCGHDEHTVLAIGPSFEDWDALDPAAYQARKASETDRLIGVLERRFPGFSSAVRYAEVATPKTIERFCLKNGGAVAGPKQMLGQHMFRRLHTQIEFSNLFCCGESTVMGTGTPTVTTEGLAAANAILRDRGLAPFVYDPERPDVVRFVDKPFTRDRLFEGDDEATRRVRRAAMRCRFCEHPTCARRDVTDVGGITRRVAVGNMVGARRCWDDGAVDRATLASYEARCIRAAEGDEPVAIREIVDYLETRG